MPCPSTGIKLEDCVCVTPKFHMSIQLRMELDRHVHGAVARPRGGPKKQQPLRMKSSPATSENRSILAACQDRIGPGLDIVREFRQSPTKTTHCLGSRLLFLTFTLKPMDCTCELTCVCQLGWEMLHKSANRPSREGFLFPI